MDSKMLKLVAVFELLGGCGGLIFVIKELYRLLPLSLTLSIENFVIFFICLTLIFLYSYNIVAGYLLIVKEDRGIKHTFICQLTQLFGINVFGWSFFYCSLVYFVVFINSKFQIGFNFEFGAYQNIGYFAEGGLELQINIIALAIILFLRRSYGNILFNKASN